MALLTKSDILSADDLTHEIVSVPEWGGDVRVCVMSGELRDRFEAAFVDAKGGSVSNAMANIRARLAAWTIRDEAGERLFTDRDIAELGAKSAVPLDRVFQVAQRINGLSKSDVEELAGNSEAAQSGNSGSD